MAQEYISYNPIEMQRKQLLHFLRVAGASDVKGIVYLDMSGMVKEALLTSLKFSDNKGLLSILTAIETNIIVTLDNAKFVRLRLDLASKGMFKEEDVALSELLG